MEKISDIIKSNGMKNFPIEKDGKTYWVSRSIAVLGLVLSRKDGEWYVLVNKRGEGCPDFNGMWNIPCGYLDYNETTKEAVAREVHEECGLDIDPSLFTLFAVNDDPKDAHQNVTLRYIAKLPTHYMYLPLSNKDSEEDEVEGIKWVNIKDIDNYQWAFNHYDLLKNTLPGLLLNTYL